MICFTTKISLKMMKSILIFTLFYFNFCRKSPTIEDILRLENFRVRTFFYFFQLCVSTGQQESFGGFGPWTVSHQGCGRSGIVVRIPQWCFEHTEDVLDYHMKGI